MLNYVQITGQYTGVDQSPATGTVVFTPNTTCYAPGIPELSPGTPITAQIVAGSLRSASGGTLSLLATDNTLNFTGRTGYLSYQVQETVNGVVFDAWSFTLPYSKYGAGPVDINSLANTTAGSTGIVPPAGDIGGTSSSPTVVSTHLASPLPVAQGGTAAATAAAGLANLGGAAVAGDIGGTSAAPQVTGTHLAAPLPIAQGGTGTATGAPQNDVLAGPATGGAGAPSFRALAAADLPAATGAAQGAVQLAGDLAGTAASPQVTGTHLAAPLPLAQGGTGQSTQQSALDALAGAVTAAQFLRGSGTHVQMSAIQPGDLAPAGSPPPGKYAALMYGAVWGMPWQFWPDSYGAAGDGKVLGDCSITSGQAVLSSGSYGFTSADVGKYVMLNGGLGTANVPLIAAILSVSAGNATLSANATVTISGNGACVFGTDVAAALASTFSAAGTYALAGSYDAEIILWGIYVAASAPAKSGNGTTVPYFYSQVPLPYPQVSGASRKAVITVTGPAPQGHAEYWESTVPNVLPGSVVSMVTTAMVGNTPDPTYGRASVIGGPSGSAALTGAFANTKAVFRNVAVWLPAFSNMQGVDLGYIGGCGWDQSAVKAFAPVGVGGGVAPYLNQLPPLTAFQSNISRGVRFPLSGNNDDVAVGRLVVEGVETGFCCADHFTALSVATLWCDLGGLIDLTEGVSGSGHSVTISQWSCEGYNGALRSNGGGTANTQVSIVLDTEPYGGGDPLYDVSDSGSLYGTVRVGDNGTRPNRRPVVFNGAPNLKVVNDMMGPGLWTGSVTPGPPAVAASGTAVLNSSYRDCAVNVQPGTAAISAIAVNGTVLTGITAGQVRVPGGATITLTYSGGTPVWQWWRD